MKIDFAFSTHGVSRCGKKSARSIFAILGMASALSFGLSGCQEAAFKWGGDAGGLQQAREACLPRRANSEDYAACMKEKGWTVTRLDDGPADSAAPESPAAASPASPSPSSDAEMPDMNMDMSMPSATVSDASAAKPAPVAHVRAPTDPISVTSWWKAGGNAGGFSDAVSACVVTLGEVHKPDTAHHQVTRAMMSCLREKGWFGI